MDDLFGKDDSGNDSDPTDIDDMDDNPFDSKKVQLKDANDEMDVDVLPRAIKVELDDTKSFSDQEGTVDKAADTSGENDDVIDIVKHEIEIDGRDVTHVSHQDRIFDNVQPRTTPMTLKERRESKEKTKRELEEEEREKMQVLVSNFTEDQLDRYEMYRRAAFPKAAIKRVKTKKTIERSKDIRIKIMQTITGCSVSQNVVIAMSGIAKVFVGEIVEEALDVMEANDETGPLQPKHLREAVRRLRLQGQIPNGRAHKAFFRL